MKFSLWMIVSHIILVWLISFPEVVPKFLQWYGFLFCMLMIVSESKIYLDELYERRVRDTEMAYKTVHEAYEKYREDVTAQKEDLELEEEEEDE